jgi:hypothetical protein
MTVGPVRIDLPEPRQLRFDRAVGSKPKTTIVVHALIERDLRAWEQAHRDVRFVDRENFRRLVPAFMER